MLSRELPLDVTLMVWDYVLGGVYVHHVKAHAEELGSPGPVKHQEAFP
jgi:uncharacterized membrane protein (DUF485 family)